MATANTNVEEKDFMHPGTRYESVLFESVGQNNSNYIPHVLSSKAKVLTVLECYDSTDDNISSFIQHTQRQLDYDDDNEFHWTVSNLEDSKYNNQNSTMIVEKWKDLSNQFFQTYPECQRSSFDEDSSSDEDSSEDEVEIVAHCPEMMASKKYSPDIDPSQQNPTNIRAMNREKIRNPYNNISSVQKSVHDRFSINRSAHQTASQFSTPPKTEQYQNKNDWENFNAPKNKMSSWDQGNAKSNNQQYHSTMQYQENPFCTANEFVVEDSNDNGYHQRQNQNYNSQDNNQNRENPSTSFSSQSSTNVNRPPISAGLRKKFQMPKPKTSNNSPSTKSSHNTQGGGGMESRRKNSKNNDKDNDEELPPELAHLDKELVDKIMNEIFCGSDQTKITFDDIAGLRNAKQTVLELVCWPMKRPDLFTGLRKGPNGLLLFGPPGTGKTLIGKAIASESGATFFSISSSSLTSKWIGEGEKLVRTLFAVAAYKEPAVVFIDEIDSLLTQRKSDENEASRRIKTEFLVQLDGTGTSGQGRVLVIGATNRPHELDDAARRRFVKRLYIPLPEEEDRKILLMNLLGGNNKHNLTDKDVNKLAKDTDGYSGADLKALCTDAAMGPIRQLGRDAMKVRPDQVPPISYKHFKYALRSMSASVAKEDLDVYIEWNNTYGNKSIEQLLSSDEEDSTENE